MAVEFSPRDLVSTNPIKAGDIFAPNEVSLTKKERRVKKWTRTKGWV